MLIKKLLLAVTFYVPLHGMEQSKKLHFVVTDDGHLVIYQLSNTKKSKLARMRKSLSLLFISPSKK